MPILLLDNYDSFTLNIVELLRQCGEHEVILRKNDEIDLHDLPDCSHLILSPGPATPKESGLLIPLIQQTLHRWPILGICLGHQAIAEAMGGELQLLPKPKHGYRTQITQQQHPEIFDQIPAQFTVGLYHSWVVSETHFPQVLEITAHSNDGHIMALKHKTASLHGVQFHPESYMTEFGLQLMKNFLLLN